MAKSEKTTAAKEITALQHTEAQRRNIPTAEYQSIMDKEAQKPVRLAYERRNRDLDPQLMWRGKDEQDASDLIVHAPPLYIQEKVHPKALVEDLLRQSKARQETAAPPMLDLFADFNGIPEGADKTDFYQHDGHWSNRMILGDSLQVMASLAEREGLRGQVQCIYFDPPYGIKFNSNFQWSTTSRDVKDGNKEHITREPEMVKAFRDTWRDGIHSYLSYIRDRLTVARDLLTESGSIFLQIGDENVHRVRAVMDEVFGEDNFVSQIFVKKTTGAGSPSKLLAPPEVGDYIVIPKQIYSWHKVLMSYSIDLRERAVKYVQDGGLHSKACELFSISRKTLYNWLTREDLAPKKTRTGFKRKLDKEALAKHVEEHPDALLRERAVHFGVRVNSIWVALGVLKISKKNDALQGNMLSKQDKLLS